MLTIADLLAPALGATYDEPPVQFDRPRPCVITGQLVTEGYEIPPLMLASSSEFLDLVHGDLTGVMSVNACRVFKSSWNMGSRLIFEDGTAHHPLIAREPAAEQGRACWSSLVRDIWPSRAGQQMVAIVTTDTKKRIWERAKVGRLGLHTPVLHYDMESNTLATTEMNWPRLLECLAFIEEVYSLGFVKPVIARGLYSQHAQLSKVGLARSMAYERTLKPWRAAPEFLFALLIAQKA